MLKQVVLLWHIRLVYSFMQNPRCYNRNNVVKIDVVAVSVSLYIKHSEALKFFQVLKIVGKLGYVVVPFISTFLQDSYMTLYGSVLSRYCNKVPSYIKTVRF